MPFERLFIITGDHSGDIHAANVLKALKQFKPEIQVGAIGGNALRKAGAEIFTDQSRMGKIGLGSILSAPEHYLLGKRILSYLDNFQPQAVLLIDYGMFNLWLARHLKERGFKVFYFIPPQIWASRRGRIRKIQSSIDHVFCIFPFEKDLYESYHVPVTYVGHPLVGALEPAISKQDFCKAHHLDPDRPLLGIFPGSRMSELKTLLPRVLKALPLLQKERPTGLAPIQFVLAKANSFSDKVFQEHLQKSLKESGLTLNDVHVVSGQNHALMSAADLLIAKSGTTTLEAALYKTRMILIYRISPWIYPIALKIAYLPCLGLPNILTDMQNPPVPELWQDAVNPKQITENLLPLLNPVSPQSQRQLQAFEDITQKLNLGGAAENVAKGILQILEREGTAL